LRDTGRTARAVNADTARKQLAASDLMALFFVEPREWLQRCQQDRISKLRSPFAPIVEIGPTATLPGTGP
jgi:hypothetical protein